MKGACEAVAVCACVCVLQGWRRRRLQCGGRRKGIKFRRWFLRIKWIDWIRMWACVVRRLRRSWMCLLCVCRGLFMMSRDCVVCFLHKRFEKGVTVVFLGIIDVINFKKLVYNSKSGVVEYVSLSEANDGRLWEQTLEDRAVLVDKLSEYHDGLAHHIISSESLDAVPPEHIVNAVKAATCSHVSYIIEN